jgi:putative transferase (TIGR04331 family)
MGIMHYEPKSLAKKLNEVYFDINSWWNDSNIQNIRNEFSKNFCLTKNNYFHDWVSAINNIK